jgi:PAS domain S-box-containing protein
MTCLKSEEGTPRPTTTDTKFRLGVRRLRPHLSSTRVYAKMPAVVSQFSTEDLRSIFDYAAVGIAIRGLHGEWISCNEYLCDMLGYSRIELMQLTSVQLTPPDGRNAAVDYNERMIRGDIQRYSREKEYLHKSGRRIPVLINVTVIKDDNGRPSHIVSIIEDISEVVAARRILENYREKLLLDVETATAELKTAKDAAESASRTKSALLANMNHELRTPLNAIIGFSGLLSEKAENEKPISAETVCEYGRYINDAGNQLLDIINNILEISSLEDGRASMRLVPTMLSDLVDELLERLSPAAALSGVRIRTRLDTRMPRYMVEPVRLRQAIRSIIENAIKFSKSNGIIDIVLSQSESQTAIIAVSDNGIGIAKENLDEVFKPFFQADSKLSRRYNGTGLGLTLAKKFVEQHRGHIRITSNLGQGTTVEIQLPRVPELAPENL